MEASQNFTGHLNRRSFLTRLPAVSAGIVPVVAGLARHVGAAAVEPDVSRVSFVTGSDRRELVRRSLEPFRDKIANDIRGKRVIVKANMAAKIPLLSNTHPDALRGLLDFLKIGRAHV